MAQAVAAAYNVKLASSCGHHNNVQSNFGALLQNVCPHLPILDPSCDLLTLSDGLPLQTLCRIM